MTSASIVQGDLWISREHEMPSSQKKVNTNHLAQQSLWHFEHCHNHIWKAAAHHPSRHRIRKAPAHKHPWQGLNLPKPVLWLNNGSEHWIQAKNKYWTASVCAMRTVALENKAAFFLMISHLCIQERSNPLERKLTAHWHQLLLFLHLYQMGGENPRY